MSFDGLLDDLCDIYFIKTINKQTGFGLPEENENYYEDTPDLKGIPCHFNKTDMKLMTQGDPKNNYPYEKKLNLPLGTKINVMDIIVDKSNNIVYECGIPDNIRNHHITVPLKKMEEYI